MNDQRLVLPIFLAVALVSCHRDPWAARFLTKQPAERDIVGSYTVDQDSLQRTIREPTSGSQIKINPAARIVLSADHNAEFFYVPEDLPGMSCSVTGRGTWRLGKNDSYITVWAFIADEEPNDQCNKTLDGKFAGELNLYGTNPPYKLHVTIGDPDSGDAVQFQRRD